MSGAGVVTSAALDALGEKLAHCRKLGVVADLPLAEIKTLDQAEAVQADAIDAYDRDLRGYAIQATSDRMRRLLNCSAPIVSPIAASDIIASGAHLRLPFGALGMGCGFAFVFGRSFPAIDDALDLAPEDAVSACLPMAQLLGRRCGGATPLNDLTATADFGLNIAIATGAAVNNWRSLDLAAMQVRASIDDQCLAVGQGGDVMGHPLNVLRWLGENLSRKGAQIQAGEIVATGSCAGLLQVAPGQIFRATFGDAAQIEIAIT